jgi:hypothetical protein
MTPLAGIALAVAGTRTEMLPGHLTTPVVLVIIASAFLALASVIVRSTSRRRSGEAR